MTNSFDFMNVFSSGRYDRSNRSVRKAISFYKGYKTTSIVNHTEMTSDKRALIFNENDGWGHNRSKKDDGADDAVTEWDREVWDLKNKDTIKLSDMRFKREGGSLSGVTSAAKTHLSHDNIRLMIWNMHLPQYDIPARREVSDDAMAHLVKDVKYEMQEDENLNVILTGDFNLNYRELRERIILIRKIGSPLGLKCNWNGNIPQRGGTFNRQLICMQWTNMKCLKSDLLKDDNSSDHRPAFAAYQT